MAETCKHTQNSQLRPAEAQKEAGVGAWKKNNLGSHRASPLHHSPAVRELCSWAQPGLLCFPAPKPKLLSFLGFLPLPLLRFQGLSLWPQPLCQLDWAGLSQTVGGPDYPSILQLKRKCLPTGTRGKGRAALLVCPPPASLGVGPQEHRQGAYFP